MYNDGIFLTNFFGKTVILHKMLYAVSLLLLF